jgi:hypothetical protein
LIPALAAFGVALAPMGFMVFQSLIGIYVDSGLIEPELESFIPKLQSFNP